MFCPSCRRTGLWKGALACPEDMVEERLGDMLHWKNDDIAVSLGIHPKTEGELTGEEAARIAECDRPYRASIISVLS
jgi:hypothetical protein